MSCQIKRRKSNLSNDESLITVKNPLVYLWLFPQVVVGQSEHGTGYKEWRKSFDGGVGKNDEFVAVHHFLRRLAILFPLEKTHNMIIFEFIASYPNHGFASLWLMWLNQVKIFRINDFFEKVKIPSEIKPPLKK